MKMRLLTLKEFQERCSGLDYPTDNLFIMMKNDEEVGIYGITDLGNSTCEIHLEIKEESRYKTLSKNVLIYLTSFPFSLGFSRVTWWTEIKSFARLLTLFEKHGIKKVNKEFRGGSRTWFYKQRAS